MHSPVRTIASNLRWTRTGTVWADFLLRPLPYGFRPTKDKSVVRSYHQALLRALPGESLLLGVCASLDPAAVVDRMITNVDLDACPDWAAECEATLHTLDQIGPGERIFWLSVPLGNSSPTDRLQAPLRAAAANLRDTLALPRAGQPTKEISSRLEQADKIMAGIPAPFRPQPATPAQMLWLHLHSQQRGLFLDLDLPQPTNSSTEAVLMAAAGGGLPEPLLDEGGQTDQDRRTLRTLNPLANRFLKVGQPGAPTPAPASYQSLLVLSDVPSEGMLFPGSEFVGRIDESGLEIDWAMRLHVRSSAEVDKKNRRALIGLNDQFGQREGEMSHGLNTLDRAAADLAEYAAVLESDKLEVEVQATTIFCIGGPDGKTAQSQARALADYLGGAGYKVTQPVGEQENLWWAMQPGVPTSPVVRQFAQIATSRGLAATVPLASSALGDSTGSLLALNISTGRTGVVLHDIAGASARDVSGSLAIAGELGSGKALSLDTPIPTPDGWSRMGDLVPGDFVFDEQGRQTTVVAVSPVMTGRRCYKVVFSDGETVVADAEHQWTTLPNRVRSHAAKRNFKTRARGSADVLDLDEHNSNLDGPGWASYGQTFTTEQLVQTLRVASGTGQANHAIPVIQALQLPPADLPVDPYVLGAWLGDGDSRAATLTTADADLLGFIEAAGYSVTKLTGAYRYSIALPVAPRSPRPATRCASCQTPMQARHPGQRYCSHRCAAQGHRLGVSAIAARVCETCQQQLGANSTGRRCRHCWHAATLRGRLFTLGLVENKHIPAIYLRSSVAQRRALLAGLLDTDGTVAPNGPIQFTNTNPQLANEVHELACSLGYRATIREGRARLNGRDCGPKWTVAFTTADPVFWLPRKRRTHADRSANSSAVRQRRRYVTDVRETPSVPVRCIRVANDSQLFLAGRSMIATHNSLSLKKLAGDVVDRGGRIIAADRTQMGEYAHWATSVTDAVVIDINRPEFSMDPLRIFPASDGGRIAHSFLTPLLNISPMSDQGVLLSEVTDPNYLEQYGLTSLGALRAHLEGGALPGSTELARRMNVFARRDFGKAIFDENLPAPPEAPAIIVRTHTLALPTRDELQHRHLFEQLKLEKVFGRAMYALVAALARGICFQDRSTLGAFIVDEAHHVTASPEGENELIEFVRDGRKHTAAAAMASHDPEADFGSPTLRGLIPTRILMRHRDKTLAKRGLAWLDLDPDDDELLAMLVEETSPVGPRGVPEERRGEAFMRDSSGNVGRIKVLPPSLPARNEAVRTSPPELNTKSGHGA